ncbi:hypothetical protein D3C71_1741520 [compost metagenome]
MRDVDTGHTLALQIVDDRQQHTDFLGAERGGRFVENQQAGLLGKRSGDLKQLLIAAAIVHHRSGHAHIGQFQPRQQFGCASMHGRKIHASRG